MLQLLICSSRRHQQSVLVSYCQSSNETGTGNGGGHDGDEVAQLRLEDGQEVGGAVDGY